MIQAPARLCRKCKRRTRNRGGLCDACADRVVKSTKAKRKRYDQQRGSAAKRGYDRHWRKVQSIKLNIDPLCECKRCRRMGRVKPADMVHHINPTKTHQHLRLVWSNLMSMAWRCHEVEEARATDHEYEAWKREQR